MTQPGGALSNIADPNLTWERNYTTNLALEFGLFENKIFGTVEYFNRDSKDLIQAVPISTITGFSNTIKNIGEINNKGIEFELGSDIIKKQDFRWTASVNATFIDSKVEVGKVPFTPYEALIFKALISSTLEIKLSLAIFQ